MIRIVRNPPHHFVITNLPACAPAITASQMPVQADPTVESITDMNHSLQSGPLDSDLVHADHVTLIEMDSFSDWDAAHIFPALNMAQMDAGIACERESLWQVAEEASSLRFHGGSIFSAIWKPARTLAGKRGAGKTIAARLQWDACAP